MENTRRSQRGVTLLLFLFLALGIGATIFLSIWTSNRDRQERDQKTELALQQAKEALIAYAAANSLPGKLPCPEDTTQIGGVYEGKALSSCSNGTILAGRIPWRTLSLDNPWDANGEQLWYVLSPGFQNAPINSDSIGQLLIDTLPVGAVALIIAPGPPLSGQNRTLPTAAAPPLIAQYLDGTNADGDNTFTALPIAGTMNDKILAIFPADLMAAVEKRVANEVRYALLKYYCGIGQVDVNGNCTAPPLNGFFPRPATFADTTCLGSWNSGLTSPSCPSAATGNEGRIPAYPTVPWDAAGLLRGTGPTWFQQNGWRELVYYAVAPACIDGTVGCAGVGHLTVKRPGSNAMINAQVVVIVGSTYIGTTSRNKTTVGDYLEDQNASVGDNIFTQWPVTAGTAFNDHLITIP
jgi:type II secretory pathway pseudopilin PulG